jgi:hypothetical protein
VAEARQSKRRGKDKDEIIDAEAEPEVDYRAKSRE